LLVLGDQIIPVVDPDRVVLAAELLEQLNRPAHIISHASLALLVQTQLIASFDKLSRSYHVVIGHKGEQKGRALVIAATARLATQLSHTEIDHILRVDHRRVVATVQVGDQSAQVIPRRFVVNTQLDLAQAVLDLLVQYLRRVLRLRQIVLVRQEKEPLIPGTVISYVLLDELVHVVDLVLPQSESGHGPLTILPRVVVLRVAFDDAARELHLLAGVLEHVHNAAPMLPDLVVLRVAADDVADEVELGAEVLAESGEQLAAIVPDRVVGRVEEGGVACQLERSLADLVAANHRPEVAVDLAERVRVGDAHNLVRLAVLLNFIIIRLKSSGFFFKLEHH
jgi:hypothetical protein